MPHLVATLIYLSQIYSYYIKGDISPLSLLIKNRFGTIVSYNGFTTTLILFINDLRHNKRPHNLVNLDIVGLHCVKSGPFLYGSKPGESTSHIDMQRMLFVDLSDNYYPIHPILQA